MDVPAVEADVALHTVLIVDDEPEVAEMLSGMLRRAGHHATVAHSGKAALAYLAEHEVDLILSDLHMPEFNGMDLYRHVQVSYPHLRQRLIFVTGDALGATMRSFLTETEVPYLMKPFVPRDVLTLYALPEQATVSIDGKPKGLRNTWLVLRTANVDECNVVSQLRLATFSGIIFILTQY